MHKEDSCFDWDEVGWIELIRHSVLQIKIVEVLFNILTSH